MWPVALLGLAAPNAGILQLETRRRCYRLVVDFPGLHLNEISRELGLTPNLASYHLRALERNGFVSTRRESGFVRYFPRRDGRFGREEVVDPRKKAQLALLRRPTPLRIAVALLNEQELSVAQLSRQTGLGPPTLAYHLERLEAAELVRSERDGRERRCRLRDPKNVEGLLLRYRPPDAIVEGFLQAWNALEAGLVRRRRGDKRGESIL